MDGNTVMVDGTQYHSRFILLASGSVPAVLDVPGMDLPGVMNSDEILELKELPGRLLVIGGGVIGLEFSIFGPLAARLQLSVSARPAQQFGPGNPNASGFFLKRQGINVMRPQPGAKHWSVTRTSF